MKTNLYAGFFWIVTTLVTGPVAEADTVSGEATSVSHRDTTEYGRVVLSTEGGYKQVILKRAADNGIVTPMTSERASLILALARTGRTLQLHNVTRVGTSENHVYWAGHTTLATLASNRVADLHFETPHTDVMVTVVSTYYLSETSTYYAWLLAKRSDDGTYAWIDIPRQTRSGMSPTGEVLSQETALRIIRFSAEVDRYKLHDVKEYTTWAGNYYLDKTSAVSWFWGASAP